MCTEQEGQGGERQGAVQAQQPARGSPANPARPAVAMPSTITAVNSTSDTAPVARLVNHRIWVFIERRFRSASGVRRLRRVPSGRHVGQLRRRPAGEAC